MPTSIQIRPMRTSLYMYVDRSYVDIHYYWYTLMPRRGGFICITYYIHTISSLVSQTGGVTRHVAHDTDGGPCSG
jgi:hypothetical protein